MVCVCVCGLYDLLFQISTLLAKAMVEIRFMAQHLKVLPSDHSYLTRGHTHTLAESQVSQVLFLISNVKKRGIRPQKTE